MWRFGRIGDLVDSKTYKFSHRALISIALHLHPVTVIDEMASLDNGGLRELINNAGPTHQRPSLGHGGNNDKGASIDTIALLFDRGCVATTLALGDSQSGYGASTTRPTRCRHCLHEV